MTDTSRTTVSLMKKAPPHTAESLSLSDILAAANDAVTRMSRTARRREFDRPAVAAHINELAQQIAGVTLDALRTWPRATG